MVLAEIARQRAGAALIPDRLFDNQRQRLATLQAVNALPVMYPWRDFADAGGLLSYGPA